MSKKWLRSLLVLLTIAVGVEVTLYTMESVQTTEEAQPKPRLQVKHEVKGKDLHLQLSVSRFTFSLENMGKENKQGEGHAHLYVDGKKAAKIFDPHYVYRNLPPGRHEIVVELAHNNHESYGVKQSFAIEVN
ncbi:DUF4399 domain-containing protein [Brevibacillus humidisoli]|uniref:DUF4399 domain-containing protein n=1 Tax=Brevibacillus humidisoli TaxID=2895522 RepID=UPI001E3DDF14|nr:DUF4399 domain-containing protein [Brevibacillus humidisoli]UFJ42958.1 DUF4399 domain-containing protein [Brevibacillus humidisoli]